MQDLISDGQCPFSPPRAPPPGFPHFLFAAAQHPQFAGAYGAHHGAQFMTHGQQQQQQQGGPMPMSLPSQSQGPLPPTSKQEDATAALLRERTIMALDSFLQQQQQQQPHHPSGPTSDSPQSASKALMLPTGNDSSSNNQTLRTKQTTAAASSAHDQQQSSPSVTTTPSGQAPICQFASFGASPFQAPHMSQAAGLPPPVGASLKQFIMQQQQQFAAAMAAAAASAGAHNPHGHNPSGPQHAYLPLQSLFAQAAAAQQLHHQQQLGSPTLTANSKLGASPPPAGQNGPLVTGASMTSTPGGQHAHQYHPGVLQHPGEQTSPIGAAKSAARMLDLSNFLSGSLGGAPGGAPPPPPQAPSSVGIPQQLHPQHLQAIIQHHQQQMATLAQQQQHSQNACHLSRMEPQLVMSEAAAAAAANGPPPAALRKATATKNK